MQERPMARYNFEIAAMKRKSKDRIHRILSGVLVVVVVLFISASESLVELALSGLGL